MFGQTPELVTLFSEVPFTYDNEAWETVNTVDYLKENPDLTLFSASRNQNGSVSDPWAF